MQLPLQNFRKNAHKSLIHMEAASPKMRNRHFGVELGCHSSQHAIVLKIMREGAEKGANGDLSIVRQMAQELTLWLPHHIDAMDAGLVMHLRNVGYNTETGEITAPEALPETTLTSCSVEPCDDHA